MKKANLKKTVNSLKYLWNNEQSWSIKLLRKYEEILDGTLSNHTGSKYNTDHLEEAKPYHAKPFSIPKILKETRN